MPNRFEVISHPNKFRLKPGIWVEPPGTTTTEWLITTTTEEPDVQYVYYDDGIALWRKGVRDGCFVWDKALTPVGFNGIEDTDWENVRTLCPGESSTTTDDGIIQYVIYYDGITLWRKGVRDGCFVWDRAITLTGFDGIEDTDWENVRMLCGVGTTTTESPGLGFGLLYNWYAATDVRNICADGWHIPSESELDTLGAYLGGDSVAGGKLKETGFVYWFFPNTGATNEVGFYGRGAGYRHSTSGAFIGLNGFMYIISSTAYSVASMRHRVLDQSQIILIGNGMGVNKHMGASLRPIKDFTSLSHGETGSYTDPSGYIYPTICIGTQEWVSRNIKTQHYRNGDPILEVTNNAAWAALTSGALCAYNNDWSNV